MKQKKSLGQNFLKSKTIIKKIVETADIKENDIVLEIGPGKGILTEELLKKAKKVIVIEKDDRLIYFLNEKFANYIKNKKLEIIHKDILDFDINYLNIINKDNFFKTSELDIFREVEEKSFKPYINKVKKIFSKTTKKDINSEVLKYKVVANIPYYITGQVIRKFLSSDNQPSKIVLMVQKEVAKRIVDEVGSLLSLSVKIYGEPKYIKTVKAKYFSPQPKVDSAILLINNISKDFFKSVGNRVSNLNENEKDFFDLIKAGFSHKRKVLINNLKTDWKFAENLDKSDLEKILEKSNIPLKSRAENLSKEDWKNILLNISKQIIL